MSRKDEKRPAPVKQFEAIEDQSISWRRRALFAVTLFFSGALGVAAVAPVKEVAIATGEIRSAEEIVEVAHSVGGDVAAVYASPNAEVSEGAPILRIDGRALSAEIARLEIRRAHLVLRRDRLQALLDGVAFAPTADARLSPIDLANATRHYQADMADLASELAALKARLAEGAADRDAQIMARRGAQAELDAYRAKSDLSTALHARQLRTKDNLLEDAARLAEAEARVAEVEGRINASTESVEHLAAELRRAQARRRANWSTELTEATAELADVSASLDEAHLRRERLMVVAPIDGRILELGSAAPGDVVAPGEMIARIVPTARNGGSDLIAEIKISPNDIGHIDSDARAIIEITTFDSELFGEVEGRFISVSPSSILDEQGVPSFRAQLSLSHLETTVGDATLRLAPGMVVTARIVTEERTLFEYLAEPVTRALKVAFTER